jgi:uncharacterized protein (DUF2252 family)
MLVSPNLHNQEYGIVFIVTLFMPLLCSVWHSTASSENQNSTFGKRRESKNQRSEKEKGNGEICGQRRTLKAMIEETNKSTKIYCQMGVIFSIIGMGGS